uniref:Peroxidase 4 n=1 Tax=Aegilops tauschii TaxID=37682 RepID=N1QVC5_AEGTA
MVIKLSAGAFAVSVWLSLAFFVGHGQPVLADGGGGKKHDVADTVKKEVAIAMKKNPRIGAALVRLLFHDCWVHGCDGSVLLDKTPDGGSTEKDAMNNIGLEGFDLIDRIKDKLGESVSCADIVNALRDHVEDKTTAAVPDPTEMNNIRDMEFAFRNASGYNATGVDTSRAARGVLDNSYYHANLQNKVLFRSDWELRNDTTGAAGRDMREFRDDAAGWYVLFGKAMAKLSEIPAEGSRFEIRKNCRTTN